MRKDLKQLRRVKEFIGVPQYPIVRQVMCDQPHPKLGQPDVSQSLWCTSNPFFSGVYTSVRFSGTNVSSLNKIGSLLHVQGILAQEVNPVLQT